MPLHSSIDPASSDFTRNAEVMRVLVAELRDKLSLVAGGATWLHLDSGAAASSAPDKIVYSQQNGKNGEYLQYLPGDGSKSTTQPVTGGGGCATPNAVNPVLSFSAKYYAGGYNGASTSAIVQFHHLRRQP